MSSPGIKYSLEPSRVVFDGAATATQFRAIAKDRRVKVLQCSEPVPDSVWRLINEHVLSSRPDVHVRVYGFYGDKCDLSFVRLIPDVCHFRADCLEHATCVEAIADLPKIKSLSLDIGNLTDFAVLERLPSGLESLCLGPTRSKKPSLAPLLRFTSLRSLYLDGQSKGIEVLAAVQTLESLTLRSITIPDIRWLRDLAKLWYLDIKLGGIRSFAGIEGKRSIKCLELWQVRLLDDIGVISTLPGLQNVYLQSLPNINELPRLDDATSLRRIVIDNLKGLHDFSTLEHAPALEEFAILMGSQQTALQLHPILRNPRVRRVFAGLGSERENSEFQRQADAAGKASFDPSTPFVYR